MRLPIPFEFAGKTYGDAELRRPSGGVIADTRKLVDKGDLYAAIGAFVAGCLDSLGDESDRGQLRVLSRELPYPDAEFLATRALLLAGVSDDLEAVYSCPRCHKQLIVDVDAGERISEIPVKYTEEPVSVELELDEPVVIRNQATQEELIRVERLRVACPTLGQLSRAFNRHGMDDLVRLQFAAYVDATQEINGAEVDGHWRSTWGMLTFDRMLARDVNRLTAKLREFGMAIYVERVCLSCGKRWEAEVDTEGFFASGLRGE